MHKHITLGVLSGALLTVVNIVVNVLVIKLVVSGLDPKTAGIWFIFLNIGSYVLLLDLGISPTVSREIGFIIGKGDSGQSAKERDIADYVRTTGTFFQILAVVVLLVSFLIGIWAWVSRMYSSSVCAAWLIFSIGATINLLGGPAFSSLFGLGQVSVERLIKSITQVLWLLGAWLFLRLGTGIIGLAVAWTIQSILTRMSGWWYLYRSNPWLKHSGKVKLELLRRIASPSIKWAAMGLGAILILQTDNLIIAYSLGAASVPRYEPVMKIVWILMTFSLIFSNTSVPFASRLYAAKDESAFNLLLMRNVRYCVGFAIILTPFIAVYADRIVYVWLGDGYFSGFYVVLTLLTILLLEIHHVVHASAVMAAGHIIFLPPALIAGVLKVLISLVLVGKLGLWGVALGTLFAQALTNNWYAPYKSWKIFKYSISGYVCELVVPLLLAFVVNFLVAVLSRGYTAYVQTLWGLTAHFFVYSVVSLISFWLIVIPTDEKRQIIAALKLRTNEIFA